MLDVLANFDTAGGARPWPDVFVLELSSFQLETTSSLRPVAAAVLNVTENHLDRYASMEDYAAAKARVFARRRSGRQRDDPLSFGMRIPGHTSNRSARACPAEGVGTGALRRHDWLRTAASVRSTSSLSLVGPQCIERAARGAFATVARINRNVLDTLKSFHGLPHRMQKIAEAGRVIYIDDSKATTIVATQAALDGIERPAVLIAGGDGKGQDFRPLKSSVDADCRAVLLIGRDAPLIARALEGTPAHVEMAGTLDAAIERAVVLAEPGDAVLLSPACASLDQFGSYIERGNRFADLVHARLKELAAHA